MKHIPPEDDLRQIQIRNNIESNCIYCNREIILIRDIWDYDWNEGDKVVIIEER